MSSTLLDDALAAPFQAYKPHSHADIPHLIEYLALICQDPEVREHQLAFDELETIIDSTVECEGDAATAKTIVSTLFQTVTNVDTVAPELPLVVAQLTQSIMDIIPDTMRDWTRAEHSEQGKELFHQLLLEGINFYSGPPPHQDGDEEIDAGSLFMFLQHSATLQLSDYIRELTDLTLVDSLVVYGLVVKFLHSLAVPTPSPLELECVCHLLRITEHSAREVLWTDPIINALEIIRARDGHTLDQKIHVLLLVLLPCLIWLMKGNNMDDSTARQRIPRHSSR
jgi:hypothetical protein